MNALNIGTLATADLSQIDVLFVQNSNNGGYSLNFTSQLAKVHQFVANGGVLVFHDRAVDTAETVLPGAPGDIRRNFDDPANINVLDNTTLVTSGPGGVIDNTSLDAGTSSSHGWILASSIPPDARAILSTGDASHVVTYSYGFGTGKVVYSTIPLDFYLVGSGPPAVNANMQRYAANVVAYGNSIR
jgi:hypothetical protein